MRYVRTLKGLSPAPVNLVTKQMGKSVKVNISVAHTIIAFSAFISQTHLSWTLSYELELAYINGLKPVNLFKCNNYSLMIFLASSLNTKLLPATGITSQLDG